MRPGRPGTDERLDTAVAGLLGVTVVVWIADKVLAGAWLDLAMTVLPALVVIGVASVFIRY